MIALAVAVEVKDDGGHCGCGGVWVVIHPGFNLIAEGVFSGVVLSSFRDRRVFGVVVMPGGAFIEGSQRGAPDGIAVGLYPICVDLGDGDYWEAAVTGGVFYEVAAVGGADNAAGAHKGFNATAIGLAHVISGGGQELFEGFGFALADYGINFAPFMNPGGMELEHVVLEVAEVTEGIGEPGATEDCPHGGFADALLRAMDDQRGIELAAGLNGTSHEAD